MKEFTTLRAVMVVCRSKRALSDMQEEGSVHPHFVPLFMRTAVLEEILRNEYAAMEYYRPVPLHKDKERDLVVEIEFALDNPDQPYPNKCLA